jgi:hypothetical protein
MRTIIGHARQSRGETINAADIVIIFSSLSFAFLALFAPLR